MNSMKPVTNENGAAALEFALVLPLLLLLIFGIIEFGIILFDKAVLTNSCREGARAGIVSKSPRLTRPEINNIVDNCQDHLITFGASPTLVLDTTPTNPAALFNDDLQVTATYNYDFFLMPSFIPGLPQTLPITATTVMKYE